MVTKGTEYHGYETQQIVELRNNQDIDEDGIDRGIPLFSFYEQCLTASHTHVYISQAIGAPAAYIPLIQFLNSRQQGDVVHIHLNSPGGRLDTGIQIVTAIQNSAAQCIAHLDSIAYSMAAVIFLACEYHAVSPYGKLMLHTYSGGGCGGKAPDQRAAQIAVDDTYARIVQDICIPFLTKREVKDMLENSRDLYFGYEEIVARLNPAPKPVRSPAKRKAEPVQVKVDAAEDVEHVEVVASDQTHPQEFGEDADTPLIAD